MDHLVHRPDLGVAGPVGKRSESIDIATAAPDIAFIEAPESRATQAMSFAEVKKLLGVEEFLTLRERL